MWSHGSYPRDSIMVRPQSPLVLQSLIACSDASYVLHRGHFIRLDDSDGKAPLEYLPLLVTMALVLFLGQCSVDQRSRLYLRCVPGPGSCSTLHHKPIFYTAWIQAIAELCHMFSLFEAKSRINPYRCLKEQGNPSVPFGCILVRRLLSIDKG